MPISHRSSCILIGFMLKIVQFHKPLRLARFSGITRTEFLLHTPRKNLENNNYIKKNYPTIGITLKGKNLEGANSFL